MFVLYNHNAISPIRASPINNQGYYKGILVDKLIGNR